MRTHITRNITTGKGTMKTTKLVMIADVEEIGASLRNFTHTFIIFVRFCITFEREREYFKLFYSMSDSFCTSIAIGDLFTKFLKVSRSVESNHVCIFIFQFGF
jgi:hypothetical protein